MNDYNMEDYAGLAETGYESKEPINPEDEYFHSVYVAGQARKNHIGVNEEIGKLQIRGVDYNKEEVNMIITNVKEILVKVVRKNNKDSLECFSYKLHEPPWKGTSGNTCGTVSAERANDSFCNTCRAQIIVSGIYCEASGKPILNNDGKPVFIFLRGKGMKYSNISSYLGEISREDFDPIFTPATDESRKFEKSVVNNKRHVTKITVGEATSSYGIKKVFDLDKGAQLPNNVVMDVLKITKKSLSKFNEKFNWALGKTTGYTQTEVTADQQFPDSNQESTSTHNETHNETQKEEPAKSEALADNAFDFEDMKF